MSIRGRKPKPTHLKIAQGNPGKRKLNTAEPQPPAVEKAPPPPALLGQHGKREWRRLAPILLAMGVLSEADLTALLAYCKAYERWYDAEQHLRREGTVLRGREGGRYQNPYLAVSNRAFDQMQKLGPEFGLTPSARSRIEAAQKSPKREKAREDLNRRLLSPLRVMHGGGSGDD